MNAGGPGNEGALNNSADGSPKNSDEDEAGAQKQAPGEGIKVEDYWNVEVGRAPDGDSGGQEQRHCASRAVCG